MKNTDDPVKTLAAGMVNPWSITDVGQLRKALVTAQADVIIAAKKYAELHAFTAYLNRRLTTLIDAYDGQDHDAIESELAELSRHLQTERAEKHSKAH